MAGSRVQQASRQTGETQHKQISQQRCCDQADRKAEQRDLIIIPRKYRQNTDRDSQPQKDSLQQLLCGLHASASLQMEPVRKQICQYRIYQGNGKDCCRGQLKSRINRYPGFSKRSRMPARDSADRES